MPRAFVTGATGFVGLNLVRELLERGWDVVALHRSRSKLTYLKRFDATLVEGDIVDPSSLRRAMPERPDAVFHVAANLNTFSRRNAEQTRDNVEGTRNVVDVALEKGVERFVHTSSIAAYGPNDHAVTEEHPLNGLHSWINYPRTKALAEEEVRRGIERGLDAVTLNPANVMGPYDLHGWSSMIYLAHRGRLPFVPPGRGSFCHVREVARAHVTAVERGRTGENYLLGGPETTYLDLVRVIGETIGRKVPSRVIPGWALRTMARAAVSIYPLTRSRPMLTPETAALAAGGFFCRSDKAIRELGYREVDLKSMVADSYDWMKKENRLSA